jgi:hypothetical protein
MLVSGMAGTMVIAAAGAAPAEPGRPLPDTAVTGVHNAYVKATFPHLVDALESGTGMIELDIWQNFLGSRHYVVGHSALPDNNCVAATRYEQLRTGWRNRSLARCLDDIRLWHQHSPDHPPLILKLEMKNGFDDRHGFGPDEFDRLLADKLGAATVFTPADLLGGRYPDADTASRAGAWPSREELRGRIIVLVQRGTFEQDNPLDHYHTELEYADHLAALAAAGRISSAMMFPTVLSRATAADPRTGELGGTRKPWYVSFDASATAWMRVDTGFYTAGHYLLTMTAAHAVEPPIDAHAPTPEQAAELAGHGASVVSSDWTAPGVLGLTAPRS